MHRAAAVSVECVPSVRVAFVRERAEVLRRLALAFAVGLLTAAAYGQNAPLPRFEVASIKPGKDVSSTRPDRSRGRIRWTTQLAYLIGYAYHLDFSRLSCSLCGSVYIVEATFDPAATDDRVRLMVQALLRERFKMRFHPVTTQADGYAMSIGKGGLQIREISAADEPPLTPERGKDASSGLKPPESYISATIPAAGVVAITGRRVTMPQLAATLERTVGMPVWDRTGLTGNYDFAFRYAEGLSIDLETDAPSLAAALQENLGIKLAKQKGPLETLVIDYIEEPSEN